jgi:hypothetical protein
MRWEASPPTLPLHGRASRSRRHSREQISRAWRHGRRFRGRIGAWRASGIKPHADSNRMETPTDPPRPPWAGVDVQGVHKSASVQRLPRQRPFSAAWWRRLALRNSSTSAHRPFWSPLRPGSCAVSLHRAMNLTTFLRAGEGGRLGCGARDAPSSSGVHLYKCSDRQPVSAGRGAAGSGAGCRIPRDTGSNTASCGAAGAPPRSRGRSLQVAASVGAPAGPVWAEPGLQSAPRAPPGSLGTWLSVARRSLVLALLEDVRLLEEHAVGIAVAASALAGQHLHCDDPGVECACARRQGGLGAGLGAQGGSAGGQPGERRAWAPQKSHPCRPCQRRRARLC